MLACVRCHPLIRMIVLWQSEVFQDCRTSLCCKTAPHHKGKENVPFVCVRRPHLYFAQCQPIGSMAWDATGRCVDGDDWLCPGWEKCAAPKEECTRSRCCSDPEHSCMLDSAALDAGHGWHASCRPTTNETANATSGSVGAADCSSTSRWLCPRRWFDAAQEAMQRAEQLATKLEQEVDPVRSSCDPRTHALVCLIDSVFLLSVPEGRHLRFDHCEHARGSVRRGVRLHAPAADARPLEAVRARTHARIWQRRSHMLSRSPAMGQPEDPGMHACAGILSPHGCCRGACACASRMESELASLREARVYSNRGGGTNGASRNVAPQVRSRSESAVCRVDCPCPASDLSTSLTRRASAPAPLQQSLPAGGAASSAVADAEDNGGSFAEPTDEIGNNMHRALKLLGQRRYGHYTAREP